MYISITMSILSSTNIIQSDIVMSADKISHTHSIKFNDDGVSKSFELKYCSYFNLFDDVKKVTARFRKIGELIAIDYKFLDSDRWFKAFESNNQMAHYLLLKNNELVIKTFVDYWKVASIKL